MYWLKYVFLDIKVHVVISAMDFSTIIQKFILCCRQIARIYFRENLKKNFCIIHVIYLGL